MRRSVTFAFPISVLLTLSFWSAAAQSTQRPAGPGAHESSPARNAAIPDSNSVSFLPVVDYNSGGGWPGSVALADINGDGKLDIIVTNGNYSSGTSFAVLLGNGDGTFQPAIVTPLSTIGEWNALAVSDVNNDGKPDLIIVILSAASENDVAVILGNGDGTFKAPVIYDSGGNGGGSIAVADVNGDGKPDIALASWDNSAGGLTILLNNGDGTFGRPISSGSPVDPGCLVLADTNSDGILDALICSENSVAVLLGDGDGSFQYSASNNFYTGFLSSVAVLDANGDHRLDLVTPNDGSNGCITQNPELYLGLLLGNGNGTFQSETNFPVLNTTCSGYVAVGDFDGDGKQDLSITTGLQGPFPGTLAVMLGKGDGTFLPPVTFRTDGGATGIATGDLNGDGKPDVVIAGFGSNTVDVLINNTNTVATQTSVSSSLNPSLTGQAITFTSTVTSSAGSPPDGETITFYNGTAVLGRGALIQGKASFTTSSFQVGTYIITATYAGDSNFAFSTSNAVRQVVNSATKTATSTSFTCTPTSSIYGQKVTLAAVVTGSGGIAPTGRVQFNYGRFTLTAVTLNGSGVATVNLNQINADTYPLFAQYMGDANNLGSSSPVVTLVVQPTTSTVGVRATPNPAVAGQTVTITAGVTSPTTLPMGQVTFSVGKTVLGTAQLAKHAVNWSQASITTTSLPVGTDTISATFLGNSNIQGGTATTTETITKSASTTAQHAPSERGNCDTQTILTTSATPWYIDGDVYFTAQLNASAFCNGQHQSCGGDMKFYDGNTYISEGQVSGPACSTTIDDFSLKAGTHKIKAVFQGLGFWNPSSTVITQVIQYYPTTSSLTTSLNPSIYGQPITWTALVNPSPITFQPPSGNVSFTYAGRFLGSAPINPDTGVASLTMSILNADPYAITAVYKGDGVNGPSTSPAINQVVLPTTSSATIASSANPSTLGESVTFTSKVLSPTATAKGPVTFTAGNTVLGTVELASGKASLTTSSLTAGTTMIT